MADDKKKSVASETKRTLAAKLAKIGREIGKVEKSGKNSQQNYNYIEYGVVAGRIRELFDEHGVIIIPSVEDVAVDTITNKYGNAGYHYRLTMSFTIINGDDPTDTLTASWVGESADYGDKGINKAETSGTKYFLMRLFNVSEKGETEADKESPEMRASQPVARQATAPVKKPVAAPTDAQRKELSAYLIELGKTEEEIADVLAKLNSEPIMLAAIEKAKNMLIAADEKKQGGDK